MESNQPPKNGAYKEPEGPQQKKPKLERASGGSFVFSGGTGYATNVNGTYEVVDGESVNGKPVFRQIENPLNWFEYVVPVDLEGLNEETRLYLDGKDDDEVVAANAIIQYNGWVAKWTAVRGDRFGYVRSAASASDTAMAAETPAALVAWEVINGTTDGEGYSPNTSPGQQQEWWNGPHSGAIVAFKESEPIRLHPVTDMGVLATARAKFAAAEARLVGLADGTETPSALMVDDDVPLDGEYQPVLGKLEGRRPVYTCDEAGQNEFECKIYYDDTKCMWRVDDGNAGDGGGSGDNPSAWSLAGCAAALPQEVEYWMYDDDVNCVGIYGIDPAAGPEDNDLFRVSVLDGGGDDDSD